MLAKILSKVYPHRRQATTICLLVVLVLFAALGIRLLTGSHAAVPTWNFHGSGIAGTGFQNVIAMSPQADSNDNYVLVDGADVGGISRSIDGATTWIPSNQGQQGAGYKHVSSVYWSPHTSGKVWIAGDNGLYASTNFGQSWSLINGDPGWAGNGATAAGQQVDGNEHPRSTGTMIAESSDGSDLWVVTYRGGVWHSSDGGASWDHKYLTDGSHMGRGIAMDPNNPGTVYVAMRGSTTPWSDGVYKITNADTANPSAPVLMSAGPDQPEELLLYGGKLYVAAGKEGMFMYDGSWHDINNGDISTSLYWQSLDAYTNSAGKTVIIAGSAGAQGSGASPGGEVEKSIDPAGGGAWTQLMTSASQQQPNLYGSSTKWWSTGNSYCGINGQAFVASDIVVNPRNPNVIWVAGRCGVWKTDDGGSTWSPADTGLNVVVGRSIAADPHIGGRVYATSMDWSFFASNDHLANVVRSTPASVSGGLDVAYGTAVTADQDGGSVSTPADVYLAAGSNRNYSAVDNDGEVYENDDPVGTPNAWHNLGLHTVSNGGYIFNLGVGHVGGNTIVLASVDNDGFYRHSSATGAWTKISNGPFATGLGQDSFTIDWVGGSNGLVFASDNKGVWKSTDGGLTWTHIVTTTSGVNMMSVDPTNSNRIYYSVDGQGVYRLSPATASATPVQISTISTDLMTVGTDGSVFALVATYPAAALYHSTNPTAAAGSDVSFDDISTSYIKGATNQVAWIASDQDNYLYTAALGMGFTVGDPPSSTTDNPPSISLTAPGDGTTVSNTIPVQATASDDHGNPSVVFSYRYANDTSPTPTWYSIGTDDAAPPYAQNWDTTSVGNCSYRVHATATDSAGQTKTSNTVTVTVSNSRADGNGDANGDSRINALDLSQLLGHDGLIYPAADFNHDCTITGADLTILLSHWTW